MDHIREPRRRRIGFKGRTLKHPDIVELVGYAKSLGFCSVSMSTNGFLLPASFDRPGRGGSRPVANFSRPDDADCKHGKVDAVNPAQARLVQDSKIRLNVSGVLFKETLDEMGQVIDTCLDRASRSMRG